MTASIIDGAAVARELREELAVRVQRLAGSGVVPGLAVVKVGDDPASAVYVRNKAKACVDIGMRSDVHAFSAALSEAELLDFIAGLNHDPAIHGILVQLPLPAHIRKQAVLEAIAQEKDVDGFHLYNVGGLVVGAGCGFLSAWLGAKFWATVRDLIRSVR